MEHTTNNNQLLSCILNKLQIYYNPTITKYIVWLLPIATFSLPLSTALTNMVMITLVFLWILEGNYLIKIQAFLNKNFLIFGLIILSLILGTIYSIAPSKDVIQYCNKMHKLIYLILLVPYFTDVNLRKKCMDSFIAAGLIIVFIGFYRNTPQVFKNTIDTSLVVSLTTFLMLHKFIHQIIANNFSNINNPNALKHNHQLLDINNNHGFNYLHKIKNFAYLPINIIIIILNIFYLFYIAVNKTSQIIFPVLLLTFIIQRFAIIIKYFKQYFILSFTMLLLIISSITTLFVSKNFDKYWINLIKEHKTFNYIKPIYTSYNARRIYYYNSLQLIKAHPIIGTGTGSFPFIYKNFIIKHQVFNIENPKNLFINNPHNEYLLFGTQFGIYGIIILLLWFINLFKISFNLDTKLQERYILQGLIINMLIGCGFNSWLLDFTAGHLFIIFTAICLGALPHEFAIRYNQSIGQSNN